MAQDAQFQLVENPGCIDHTPGSAVTGGEPVITQDRVEIARSDIAASRQGAVHNEPAVYDGVKVVGAITDGDDLYWDADGDPEGGTAGTGALTTDHTKGEWFGRCVASALSADEKVRFVFCQQPPKPDIEREITDPGDAGAIPVTASGYVNIVTAGAETRTLAAPTFQGQVLVINLKTDGGDAVITCATTVNQTANNTLTAADAGDQIVLMAGISGANLRWRVQSNDGVALATV